MARLDDIQRGIDRQIAEAQKKGKFDNLPGAGEPLKLDSNPLADPAAELANKLLKDNDFLPPWMDRGQRIDRALAAARAKLTSAWKLLQDHPGETWLVTEWKKSQDEFRAAVGNLNAEIRNYNLEIPNVRFERFSLDAEREIQKVQAA
jgi:hypothetical protein